MLIFILSYLISTGHALDKKKMCGSNKQKSSNNNNNNKLVDCLAVCFLCYMSNFDLYRQTFCIQLSRKTHTHTHTLFKYRRMYR